MAIYGLSTTNVARWGVLPLTWQLPHIDIQPGLSWRASTLRQMALAGTPARYKSFSVIRQYGPTFAAAHGGIQYVSSGGFP